MTPQQQQERTEKRRAKRQRDAVQRIRQAQALEAVMTKHPDHGEF